MPTRKAIKTVIKRKFMVVITDSYGPESDFRLYDAVSMDDAARFAVEDIQTGDFSGLDVDYMNENPSRYEVTIYELTSPGQLYDVVPSGISLAKRDN